MTFFVISPRGFSNWFPHFGYPILNKVVLPESQKGCSKFESELRSRLPKRLADILGDLIPVGRVDYGFSARCAARVPAWVSALAVG